MSGLSISKAKSQRVICANNFTQLNRCWALYSQVNRNQICPFRIVNGADNLTAWTAYLKPYYADHKIMLCPADPRTKTIKSGMRRIRRRLMPGRMQTGNRHAGSR